MEITATHVNLRFVLHVWCWCIYADSVSRMRLQNLGVKKYSLLGWSDGGITAVIMAARRPDLVSSLVTWGANAFVTRQDVALYEKIRSIDNWSEAMRKPFIQVYGEEYFRTQFNLWFDAISAFLNKANGNMHVLLQLYWHLLFDWI